MSAQNATWYLRRRPQGALRDGDIELVESDLEPLAEGEVRVRTLYISIDPTNRIWMSDIDGYFPPIPIDAPLYGASIGVVEESRSDAVAVGAVVHPGRPSWARYNTAPANDVTPLAPFGDLPYSVYLGPLGGNGLTAYFGLLDIAKPKAGETLVVSAAAGGVGSLVGQIGKIHGCRVVGIAGSDEKCRWLTERAGFDAAINYKTEDLDSALTRHCPDGVDINFENVGGVIMDTVIKHLNDFSRMPLCGLISAYNAEEPVPGPYNFGNLLMRRTLMKGFIVIDYADRFPEAFAQLAQWVQEGKLVFEMDVLRGMESIPAALRRLFEGGNLGKLVVQVSEP
ncbi:MAG: NADP-dependent oxidoreductase [Caulobacterales bacterium]|nr:NADP-dependent oxidoreductase [Caulobacterales bacterium]